MSQFKAVMSFEYLLFAKSRGFLFSTILMVLVALALPCIPNAAAFIIKSAAERQDGASSGTFSIMLTPEYFGGISEETAVSVLFPEFNSLDGIAASDPQEMLISYKRFSSALASYILEFILYFALVMYGQYVIISLIREKSSRTIEMLITSVTPVSLMFGKVIGVGLAGFTQMAVTAFAGVISLAVNMLALMNTFSAPIASSIAITDIVAPASLMLLFLFFIAGFFFYAFLHAVFASMASRMEDANSASFFPLMLAAISFILTLYGMTCPDSQAIVALSYIPPFAPMLMFMRYTMESAMPWEALLSALICASSSALLGYLASKVFKAGVLLYGKPAKFKEIYGVLRRQEA